MKENPIARRTFLRLTSISTISALGANAAFSQLVESDSSDRLLIDHAFRLTDYRNMLNLEFYFINLSFKEKALFRKRHMLGRYSQQESYMIVRLPQQHIAEQALSLSGSQTAIVEKTKAEQALRFSAEPKDLLKESPTVLEDFTAQTCISGYSYLVFRIVFSGNSRKAKIPLTVKALMDWNVDDLTKRGYNFKLVVKQNLNTSLFEVRTRNLARDVKSENSYPLNYTREVDSQGKDTWSHDYNAYPKVYGDPVTAIEAPWRIILSPALPDQDRFDFHWSFSSDPAESDKNESIDYTNGRNSETQKVFRVLTELWTATLTLKENREYVKRKIIEARQNRGILQAPGEPVTLLAQETALIQLMLLGSPDAGTGSEADRRRTALDDFFKNNQFVSPVDGSSFHVLPDATQRKKLVELYIKYRLIATTDKLMFSPLGISFFLEFNNSRIEQTLPDNNIYSWKHLISFGRDEEVELVTLIMDKELGHQYLLIDTAKRRTKRGISYLDFRSYLKPLVALISYESQEQEKDPVTDEVLLSRFQSPFRQITIKELKPKRILPSKDNPDTYKKVIDAANTVFYPLDFYTGQPVQFEYQGIDWQDQQVTFNKNIQAIPFTVNDSIAADKEKVNEIIEFFEGGKLDNINSNLAVIASEIYRADSAEIRSEWQRYHQRLQEMLKIPELPSLNDIRLLANNATVAIQSLPVMAAQLQLVDNCLKEMLGSDYLNPSSFNAERLLSTNELRLLSPQQLSELNKLLSAQIGELKSVVRPLIGNAILTAAQADDIGNKLRDIAALFTEDRLLGDTLRHSRLYQQVIQSAKKIDEVITLYKILKSGMPVIDDLNLIKSEIAKLKSLGNLSDYVNRQILNTIAINHQKIAFTVRNLETELDQIQEDTISNLKTAYILFRGKLQLSEKNLIGFFTPYASFPQLQRAQSYVQALNQLVNEEIPVNFRYAKDYIASQVESLKLEVTKNAARVFAEVTEASRDHLKGQIRKVASAMGGYINPEIPVEYITYLKDPKKLKETLGNELKASMPAELKDLYQDSTGIYNDLVFISGQARQAWKDFKQIRPADFFHGLDARILGSIALKDILGLDFELPKMTILKDHRGLPEKVVYNFITDKIQQKDLDVVIFYARNKGKKAAFQIYLEKGIADPRQYRSFTRLENFSIGLKPFGPEILTVLFTRLEVSSSNSKSMDTKVQIDDIKFGGPLNFVGKLAEALKIAGNGLRVIPSLREIEIGYLFTLPSIETPAFNLSNLKFDLALNIPLPNPSGEVKELTTSFFINRPEDKFLVTAGIFGGRGHFVITSTATKLILIDAAIEYGGYFGLNLGIAKGYVFLFAGIRFVSKATPQGNNVVLTAYIICSGGVTVFGFISVSVTFLLLMSYNISDNSLFGSASVSYSVRIGFFKKSFTLRYSKKLMGSKGKQIDPNVEQQVRIGTFHSEEIYYASLDEYIPREILQDQTEERGYAPEKTDFKSIYSREEYKLYFRSFKRN